MTEVVKIKIKQLDERVATNGIFMGGNTRLRRKLEPSEVVGIPTDLEQDGGNLLEILLASDKVEITKAPFTRPLDYESELDAKYCSPSFKPRDDSEERDAALAQDKIAKQMAILNEAPKKKAAKKKTEPQAPTNPRAARREQRIQRSAE